MLLKKQYMAERPPSLKAPRPPALPIEPIAEVWIIRQRQITTKPPRNKQENNTLRREWAGDEKVDRGISISCITRNARTW